MVRRERGDFITMLEGVEGIKWVGGEDLVVRDDGRT